MDWVTQFDKQMKDYLPDMEVLREESMAKHTSFRVGGPAKRMAFPEQGEQLVLLLSIARDCGARPLVIGNGTNLLVPDEGLDRLVIATGRMQKLETQGEPKHMVAAAGVPLAKLADYACKLGSTGLEFAHGIPGSVGGGVYMNAGAYGGELGQVISSVSSAAFPPEEEVRMWKDSGFSYRHSRFQERDEFILRASFSLKPGDPAGIKAKMDDLARRRREKQPLEYPSAGSTFKRPEPVNGQPVYAAALIDGCGLKGLAVGGAQVSEKHAGFVINRGGATCGDIVRLMAQVRERVLRETGVTLEPEVRYLGKEGEAWNF